MATASKRKRKPRPYVRSPRLHETKGKSAEFKMFDNTIDTRIDTYHRESFTHALLLADAPRCRLCGQLPTTLGDYIYSQFQSLYKCETCFSVYPHFLATEKYYKTWIHTTAYPFSKHHKRKTK